MSLQNTNPICRCRLNLAPRYLLIRFGRALVFEVEYHPLKKIHVIRVVFQDQPTYIHHLGVQKNAKLEKSVCFWSNFGKDMMDKLRKTDAKMCI